jgi:hypothetical protein
MITTELSYSRTLSFEGEITEFKFKIRDISQDFSDKKLIVELCIDSSTTFAKIAIPFSEISTTITVDISEYLKGVRCANVMRGRYKEVEPQYIRNPLYNRDNSISIYSTDNLTQYYVKAYCIGIKSGIENTYASITEGPYFLMRGGSEADTDLSTFLKSRFFTNKDTFIKTTLGAPELLYYINQEDKTCLYTLSVTTDDKTVITKSNYVSSYNMITIDVSSEFLPAETKRYEVKLTRDDTIIDRVIYNIDLLDTPTILLFENTLGTIDTIVCTGEVSKKDSVKNKVYKRSKSEYVTRTDPDSSININTGYHKIENKQLLEDLIKSPTIYIYQDNNLYRYNIVEGSIESNSKEGYCFAELKCKKSSRHKIKGYAPNKQIIFSGLIAQQIFNDTTLKS